ncbi:MAG: TlpA family protein disulfide reductase [Bryobacteraceae bacterium]|nr:TlpA family protein disulfide reductase [Bryobacteraceae bacterium]
MTFSRRAALAATFAPFLRAQTPAPFAPGQPAPAFRLQAHDGSWIALDDLRGSLVLLNFWATWCAPCRREIPDLIQIHKEFKPRGVHLLGISVDESGWRSVRPFVAQYQVNYPVLLADRDTKRRYRPGIEILPFTLLLDRQGRVLASFNTALDEARFRRLLNAALDPSNESKD